MKTRFCPLPGRRERSAPGSALLLRPRLSVSALLLCALALVTAILTVPSRPAEAQLAAARRPSPYSAWLQVEEFAVTYESSFNGSFSIRGTGMARSTTTP